MPDQRSTGFDDSSNASAAPLSAVEIQVSLAGGKDLTGELSLHAPAEPGHLRRPPAGPAVRV